MRASRNDQMPVFDLPEGKAWELHWGDMSIEINEIHAPIDAAGLYKGLPNDQCQCPHWGYVISGELRVSYGDHEEFYGAGDVFYMPPGHVPILDRPSEYVVFSPAEQYAETQAVVERNFQSLV